MKKAYFCTAEELEQRGKDNLPKQFSVRGTFNL